MIEIQKFNKQKYRNTSYRNTNYKRAEIQIGGTKRSKRYLKVQEAPKVQQVPKDPRGA